jgi:predicted outer membrane repeat protein
MEGGVLAGNSAGSRGGGIFTAGEFFKTAGIIWGSDAPPGDANAAESGASLYLYQDEISHENTLNEGDTINTEPGGEDFEIPQ